VLLSHVGDEPSVPAGGGVAVGVAVTPLLAFFSGLLPCSLVPELFSASVINVVLLQSFMFW
jgi:hypothetical protein